MDTRRSATLHQILSLSSRRRIGKTLTALTMTGGIASLAGLGATDAKKKHKKKKCPKPPYCAGKNGCLSPSETFYCNKGGDQQCLCLVAAETGAPFCGLASLITAGSCTECEADRTCVFAASGCGSNPFACVLPCPNPL